MNYIYALFTQALLNASHIWHHQRTNKNQLVTVRGMPACLLETEQRLAGCGLASLGLLPFGVEVSCRPGSWGGWAIFRQQIWGKWWWIVHESALLSGWTLRERFKVDISSYTGRWIASTSMIIDTQMYFRSKIVLFSMSLRSVYTNILYFQPWTLSLPQKTTRNNMRLFILNHIHLNSSVLNHWWSISIYVLQSFDTPAPGRPVRYHDWPYWSASVPRIGQHEVMVMA